MLLPKKGPSELVPVRAMPSTWPSSHSPNPSPLLTHSWALPRLPFFAQAPFQLLLTFPHLDPRCLRTAECHCGPSETVPWPPICPAFSQHCIFLGSWCYCCALPACVVSTEVMGKGGIFSNICRKIPNQELIKYSEMQGDQLGAL